MNFNFKNTQRLILRKIRFYLDSFFLLFLQKLRKKNRSGIVIIKVDGIGDFLMLGYFLTKIISKYSCNGPITIVCRNEVISLLDNIEGINQVIGVDIKKIMNNPFYRLNIFRKISQVSAYKAIHVCNSRTTWLGDSLSRFSSARYKYTLEGDSSNSTTSDMEIANNWYSQVIDCKSGTHEIKKYMLFFNETLGSDCFTKVNIFSNTEEIYADNEFFLEDYIVVFPGGSFIGKQYSIKSFVEVISMFRVKHKIKIILCGSKNEMKISNKILESFDSSSILNLCGRTDLKSLSKLIKKSRLLLSNDTLAAHIGAMHNIKTFVILGGGHYGRFFPYPNDLKFENIKIFYENPECEGCNWNCIQSYSKESPFPCIQQIRPKKIADNLISFFNE
jgi:ADP-heptose:LPS heptosyltransferase